VNGDNQELLNLKLIPAHLPEKDAVLDTKAPAYLALSYVWGAPTDEDRTVLINNVHFTVKTNLQRVLEYLEGKIKLPIWIDAICINQNDTKEKEEQVKQMREIYENAARTIIWLGESNDSTRKLFSHLYKFGKDAIDAGLNDLKEVDLKCWPEFGLDETKLKIKVKLEGLFPKMSRGYDNEGPFPLLDMIDLSEREWFKRVWVVQEFAVSREVEFRCGECTINGDHFVAGYLFCLLWIANELRPFTQGGSLPQLSGKIFSIWWRNGWVFMHLLRRVFRNKPFMLSARAGNTLGTRRKWQRRNPDDPGPTLKEQLCLSFTISLAEGLRATDDRDRIYALLGISRDTEELGIHSDYAKKISGDYVKSTAEVFTDVARILIHQGHLDILCLCRSSTPDVPRGDDLPSWVPDWRKPIFPPWGGYIEDGLFSASGEGKLQIPKVLEDPSRVLTIRALHLGKLFELGSGWNSPGKADFDLNRAQVFFSDIARFIDGNPFFKTTGDAGEAFWRIPIGDKEMTVLGLVQRAKGKSRKEFNDMLAMLLQKQDPNKMPNMVSYLTSMKDMHHSMPFRSEDGYVGLCPDTSEKGDGIFIPWGSHVAMIFRECSDVFYTVIGEAYVYGLIDGKILEMTDQLQEIRLK
jgi:hypothetical protein